MPQSHLGVIKKQSQEVGSEGWREGLLWNRQQGEKERNMIRYGEEQY
jgi:hypothetical protein